MVEDTEAKARRSFSLKMLTGLLLIAAGVALALSTRTEASSSGPNDGDDRSQVPPTQDAEGLVINEAAGKAFGTYSCDGAIFSWAVSTSEVEFISENGATVSLEKLDRSLLDITVQPSGEKSSSVRAVLAEEGELSQSKSDALKSLWASKVGHCIVEAAFKMGQAGIIARDRAEFGPFFGLAKLVYKYGVEEQPAEWDLESLSRHLTASNDKIMALRRSGKRKLLTCQTDEWFKLGDGRCDPQFNNAECNFDNGDCCPQTCKDYSSLWGGQSPEDGDGNTHPVYDCSTATAQTCVASCSASNQGRLGDGNCDADLNTESCGFDLGDCCEETCESKTFECGNSGYSCVSGSEGMCFRAGYCSNEYYGMCGFDDSCILSFCGDCRCHFECQDHDTACSCKSLLHYDCVNVFRDWCD